jgi:hypothetical protein
VAGLRANELGSDVAGLSRIIKQKGVICSQIKALYQDVQEAARSVLAGEERRKQQKAEREFAEWKAQQEPSAAPELAPAPTSKPGEVVSEEFFNYIYPETAFYCGQAIKRLVKYDIRSPGVMWGTNSGDSPLFLLRMSRWSTRRSRQHHLAGLRRGRSAERIRQLD